MLNGKNGIPKNLNTKSAVTTLVTTDSLFFGDLDDLVRAADKVEGPEIPDAKKDQTPGPLLFTHISSTEQDHFIGKAISR